MSKWHELATQVLEQNYELTESDALDILNAPDDDILDIMAASYTIRRKYFGNKVKLNMIINTKTGFFPENCGYCARSEEHTSELQSRFDLVCRLLLEKKTISQR